MCCWNRAGTFANIVGILKQWESFRRLQVLHVQPVQPGELEYHCFNTIVSTLTLERGPPVRNALSGLDQLLIQP
jgi:hypothetical protein